MKPPGLRAGPRRPAATMFFSSTDQGGGWRSPRELALRPPPPPDQAARGEGGKAPVALGAQLSFPTQSDGSGVGAAE